jgi:hypothetical protein
MVVGKRRDYNENVNTPHNVSFVFLGLALMWFGKSKDSKLEDNQLDSHLFVFRLVLFQCW